MPAIEGLKIFGEAFPGREVQACGYSINGTTNCNFEVGIKGLQAINCYITYIQVILSLMMFFIYFQIHSYRLRVFSSGCGIWKMDQ